MTSYIINGGKKLKGVVETKTAKNSAVACMCASLLTDNPTILQDVPRIQEVESLKKVLESIGVKIQWRKNELHIVPPKKFHLEKIDRNTASETRIVLLLIGALLHRFRQFRVPRAGGCKIGKRTISPHLFAFEKFGVKIRTTKDFYFIRRKKEIQGHEIIMYESGDTTTENIILTAVLARGATAIKFASANYQVQDLCYLLSAMGANIRNIGNTTLIIQGVPKLSGARYSLIPDPIESIFWISLAATTGSSLIIKGCPKDFIDLELLKLEKMGFRYKILKTYLSKNKRFTLIDIKTFPSKLFALDDKIYGRPYPGLNIDNLPFFVPIATQAKGTTLIHDWVFENRAVYYMEFQKLGANINLADTHRVFINGPTKLVPNEIVCPPALRPATILVIGMLAAKGRSVLRNTYSINRGYEDLSGRLRKLGADIREIE